MMIMMMIRMENRGSLDLDKTGDVLGTSICKVGLSMPHHLEIYGARSCESTAIYMDFINDFIDCHKIYVVTKNFLRRLEKTETC